MVRPELRTDNTGGQCLYLASVPGDPTSSQALANERSALTMAEQYPLCPESPVDTAEQPTPGAEALRLWNEQVELDDPGLWIAPGHAITGLPAFLEITGDRSFSRTFDPSEAAGYTITLHVESSYDVDRGDGTVIHGVTSHGGTWPDGDVHHTYQHRNEANVVHVTQQWTATWEATGPDGSSGGTIDDPLFTEATFPLRVGEIQAVIEY